MNFSVLAQGSLEVVKKAPLVEESVGVLAILLTVLAIIFYLSNHPVTSKFFKIIPALVFCYFVPTLLSYLNVIPHASPLYEWIKSYILPASLLLLIIALDIPGIVRLGPKAIIMLLTGTVGVVIGGPISLMIMKGYLPEDTWRGMAALSGSWIGGGANMLALKDAAEASEEIFSAMIVVDVFVANIWMGVLLFLSGKQRAIDRWTGADAGMIRDLERRMTDFQERVMRVATMPDLMTILAFGFVGSWLSGLGGAWLGDVIHKSEFFSPIERFIPGSAWKYVFVTTLGLVLSLTRARNYEGAGASKVGSVMIYLLVASIGAHASFEQIREHPEFIYMGLIWMAVHVSLLLLVGRLIRAPIFFIAVGSQANIGGAASAPIVAAAFHPSLAPVGALLAVAGYLLGTYAGLICMGMLSKVAG